MNVYLEHLLSAFNNVDKKYYSSYAFRGNNKLKDFDIEYVFEYEQYVERVFAYELYHQFRKVMECKKEHYAELVLNSEITKLNFTDTLVGKYRIFPDLVLHKNQRDCSENYQTLFIEIKVRPNDSLIQDIKKLYMAVGSRLKFQYGIMICINYDCNSPEELIYKAVRNIFISKKGKLEMNELSKKLYLLTEKSFKNFTEII